MPLGLQEEHHPTAAKKGAAGVLLVNRAALQELLLADRGHRDRGIGHAARHASHFTLAYYGQLALSIDPCAPLHGRLIPDFFQPVQFHLQLADLAEELFRLLFLDSRLGTALLSLEQALRLLLDRTLPLTHLRWVHKAANILNLLPKSLQPKAKSDLQQIWMAATRDEASAACKVFVRTCGPKYPKATECLEKNQESLLAFYDFRAEHWIHLRTTHPIESTFASVRLRTAKTRGCVARASILSMVFKLAKSAESRWRKLKGSERLAQVIIGVAFRDGVAIPKKDRQEVAA